MESPRLPPPTNGTEARLDALIGELRALRADLALTRQPAPVDADGAVELREPERSPDSARKGRRS